MIGPKPPKLTRAELARAEREARALVTGRDGGVCVKCLRVDPVFGVSWDHRQNRSQLGKWRASNGQLLCGTGTTGCHGWKTTNPAEALDEGYTVPSYADPAEWPARRWFATPFGTVRLGWCLYDDAGQVTEIDELDAIERMWGGGVRA